MALKYQYLGTSGTIGGTLLSTFVVLSITSYVWSYFTRPRRAKIPTYRVSLGGDAAKVLLEAHEECPNTPFVLSMFGLDAVILPTSEIETVKSVPEDRLSIKHHHYNVFLGEYTYMGTEAHEFDAAVRHTLIRNTPVILESFNAEVKYAVESCIGRCDNDWTAIRVRDTVSRVVSLMSSRAFVGLPLSRDPAWVEATTNYTQDVSRAYLYVRALPWFIKVFVLPFSSAVNSLKRHKKINVEKMGPLLAAKQSNGAGKGSSEPGGEVLDWFISHYEKPPSSQQLARDQLLITFASIYNLSNALSYLVFDLAAYQEYIPELRAELKDVLGDDGVIDKQTLPKLRKLDSFLRESQRLNPPSIANIPRFVTDPNGFKTSTGHIIPPGHTVMVRASPINSSSKLWPDPEKFDGFRFSKLRDQPGNEMKYQHTSTGVDNINFGHGIWACPGRFFASAELKVCLAFLITHYDLKLKPGTKKPGYFHFGFAILPDTEAEIMFKRRE
ncbi:hypothetical protein Q7P37_010906 [Cladosporium fusiforme]